ncbi:MAG: SDR family NAD(P)-dependent oxidoreductase [Bacteroidia bacterium]|nr:SDR family NAD(P)-dependent oxidoreductase [Bacteroidia bacterium]
MSKICLITGASSGIGQACARVFSQNGYHLILLARRKDRLLDLQKELPNPTLILQADVRDLNQVGLAIDSLPDSWKNIEVLINNAGLAAGLSPIDQGSLDDWEQMIDTNVKGLLYVSRKVIPLMKNQGKGHIFNISSTAGKEVYAQGNVYCATKHAVEALSKSMRIDLLDHHIKVTNIAPGMVETEFSLVRFKGDSQRAAQVYTGLKPLQGSDVAQVIFFATTLPDHVNINDLTLTATAQANSFYSVRK